ncbi:hypothetical protein B0H19DRAFT_1274114 [Mycena capillaripes]|nr:hypothetical protein B0H19DRAFT_1274114 [Mycena capillaripes]
MGAQRRAIWWAIRSILLADRVISVAIVHVRYTLDLEVTKNFGYDQYWDLAEVAPCRVSTRLRPRLICHSYVLPSSDNTRRESGRSRSHPLTSSSLLLCNRFRYAPRKFIALYRGATVMTGLGAGAERGIDPRSAGADAEYGDQAKQSQNAPQPARRSLDVTEQRAAAVALEKQRRVQDATLKALKGPERVNVSVLPMYIFLFRDDPLDTEPYDDGAHHEPSAALRHRPAHLRAHPSSSSTPTKPKIKMLEQQILIQPTINLRILSADLLLHRRTLTPIKALVEGLRRYDRDRVAAVLDGSGAGLDKNGKVVGFMTHKTLTYLDDVYEHLDYWVIAAPVMVAVFALFPSPDVKRMFHYAQKRLLTRRVVRVVVSMIA